jgi:hypothetical protein
VVDINRGRERVASKLGGLEAREGRSFLVDPFGAGCWLRCWVRAMTLVPNEPPRVLALADSMRPYLLRISSEHLTYIHSRLRIH